MILYLLRCQFSHPGALVGPTGCLHPLLTAVCMQQFPYNFLKKYTQELLSVLTSQKIPAFTTETAASSRTADHNC